MPKILAIDDKQDNLITVAAVLKSLIPDCEVITAQSGPEGIKKSKGGVRHQSICHETLCHVEFGKQLSKGAGWKVILTFGYRI